MAHLQQIAARRIGQMGLARGWSGWHDAWSGQRRRKRMLRGVGSRLLRPALAASLAHWCHDWRVEQRLAMQQGHDAQVAELSAAHAAQAEDQRAALEAAREKATAERQALMSQLEDLQAKGELDRSEQEKLLALKLEQERHVKMVRQ